MAVHGNRKYKWEEWFGRPRTVLVRGTDYHCSQSTMASMIRNAASQRGLRVRPTDTGTEIIIEVFRTREVLATRAKGDTQSKYPWDEWFAPECNKDGESLHEDGRSPLWLLERDVKDENGKLVEKRDFDVKTEAMPAKIKTAARRKYKVVQISRFDADSKKLVDSLIIRARDMTPDERVAEDLKRAEEKVTGVRG